MKTKYHYFIILMLCLLSSMGFGQSDSLTFDDVVKLKNGLVFKCSITSIDEKGITVTRENGKSFLLTHEIIHKVHQNDIVDEPLVSAFRYFDQDRRFIGQFTMGASLGSANQGLFSGSSFEGVLKARISSLGGGHHIRMNLGRMNNYTYTPISLWQVGAGYETIFSDKKVSPFLLANIGYGFGVTLNDEWDQFNNGITRTVKTNGGMNYELGAGILIRSSYGYAYTIGVSYTHQPADIDITYTGGWANRNAYDMQLRRSFLKLGFVF